MEEGLSDFRLYGPCNPRPNSPSLEYAELAWAHDAEAAHSCIVRGRHGSTEGLLNLFQPGKKNARQHRHDPVACAAQHRRCSLGARDTPRGSSIAMSPPHPNEWCFGLLRWFLLSLFQSCANGTRCAWDCGGGATGDRGANKYGRCRVKPAGG